MARRQIVTGITLVVLCLILLVFLVWGGKALFAPVDDSPQATPDCVSHTIKPGKQLKSAQVEVSVFNAGTRNGLASQTMAALADRGFRSGATGNAPDRSGVRRVQVWSTEKKNPAAELVARQFGPKVKVKVTDQDLGPGVDVIVGNGYRGVSKKAATSIELRKARTVCVPTK